LTGSGLVRRASPRSCELGKELVFLRDNRPFWEKVFYKEERRWAGTAVAMSTKVSTLIRAVSGAVVTAWA
jgi:hypothetical protein